MSTEQPHSNTNAADPPLPKMEGQKPQANDPLSFVFWFMIAFPGFLFATSPVNNTAQLIFRLALIVVGVGGLIALKLFRKR